jgi:alginate O-acetyltransferase complex protein AlgI
MVGLIVQGFIISHKVEANKGKNKAKIWMSLSVVICLGSLGFFKYYNFFIENINNATNLSLPFLQLALPLGISFYIFQVLSYVIDVYLGRTTANRSLLQFMTYATLFPQLIAGPIVRYSDVEYQLQHRKHDVSMVYSGLRRFIIGLGKKVLIANALGELCSQFRETNNQSVLFYWMYGIAFTFQIYYDFSGYSDMAIGLGRIFGFQFIENFNYPYVSKSITEFWRRWHISLSSWFRDYVYIPLGGNRVSKKRQIFNIFVVWILTGFWHGAAWNFIFWGLFYAILLILEKFILIKYIKKIPPVFAHIYVMVGIIAGFVLFNAETMEIAYIDLIRMFGLKGLPLFSVESIYYLKSYGVTFLMAILGSTPYVRNIYHRFSNSSKGVKFSMILEPIGLMCLLLVITGYLVDGSFNPFLYFRF